MRLLSDWPDPPEDVIQKIDLDTKGGRVMDLGASMKVDGQKYKKRFHGELFTILENGWSVTGMAPDGDFPWISESAVKEAIIEWCDPTMRNDQIFASKIYRNWANFFEFVNDHHGIRI